MDLLSIKENSLILLIMDYRCTIFIYDSYNVSMKLNQRTPNPLTYRREKK
jgi:hypothetical protein